MSPAEYMGNRSNHTNEISIRSEKKIKVVFLLGLYCFERVLDRTKWYPFSAFLPLYVGCTLVEM